MATDPGFLDYVVEQVGLGLRLTYRKMFGEYGIYLDGKILAFICDNSVFLKPTSKGLAIIPDLVQRPPYPGAKDYPVVDEFLEDPDFLRELFEQTAKELPPPKPKGAKRKKR